MEWVSCGRVATSRGEDVVVLLVNDFVSCVAMSDRLHPMSDVTILT